MQMYGTIVAITIAVRDDTTYSVMKYRTNYKGLKVIRDLLKRVMFVNPTQLRPTAAPFYQIHTTEWHSPR